LTFDVIIGGAGIIGLATAYKILLSKPNVKLLVLEKENGVAQHQSGHNSGVIHSGIYYKPGSLKAKNCLNGYSQLLKFCKDENIGHEICGKVIVAVDEGELSRLNNIYERGIANGLDKIRFIGKDELKEFEPHAIGIKAIHVPYAGIVNYNKVAEKLNERISQSGKVNFNEAVIDLRKDDKALKVVSSKETYDTKVFVNCCGLQSDEVASMTLKKNNLRIIPFRGEYYKLSDAKKYLVKNLIYPVPNPAFPFLGVHFTRMITGEIEAGPNAVLSFKKEGYGKTSFSLKDSLKTFSWPGFMKISVKYLHTGIGETYRSFSKSAFTKALQNLVPEIRKDDLVKGGAGVRAQAVSRDGKLIDDFVIEETENIVHVLNAPSPGATSCLSIGEHISKIVFEKLN